MKVRMLRAAQRDLTDIERYIRRDSPDAADRVMARLEAHIAHLGQFPYLGRPAQPPELRELVLPRLPYIVTYRLTGEYVDVLRVWHEAQRR